MTTKKLVMVVVSVVVVLGLIVVVFVGGIIGIALFSVGRSEAAETAKNFLRTNAQLKQEIGEVKDFGSFVTGNVSIENSNGNATINLKVIGERQTVNASVELIYQNGRPWRVTAASYRNSSGQTVDLFNPYDSRNNVLKLAA
ncbi:MAG TPA: cytochrome c oxidase assembly factor Coa1 family protein [Pyrinomonadaceae bacterium]|nr:cytochrome c oxidase assembly factor Coa1 family protein [Pyrinomonadaceae bacterium]